MCEREHVDLKISFLGIPELPRPPGSYCSYTYSLAVLSRVSDPDPVFKFLLDPDPGSGSGFQISLDPDPDPDPVFKLSGSGPGSGFSQDSGKLQKGL